MGHYSSNIDPLTIRESGKALDHSGPKKVRVWTIGLLAVLWLGIADRSAEAQGNLAGFTDKPILVLDTGGHHAPVRRLVFTADEARLLSAGDDKVVRVWDLAANPPSLAWTIRPRIWRGFAGAINGMALTPADPQGQQTLALAGYGVESNRGEIGLYHFPGAVDRRQGDIEAYIPGGEGALLPADPKGHLDSVTCLAFDPKGEVLASSSNDKTIRLWNSRTRKPLAVLRAEGQGRVNALAFTPDGQFLASGGSDGALRIWNVAANAQRLEKAVQTRLKPGRENDPDGLAINALDISPDGRWVVLGREDGALFRFDLRALDFANSLFELTTARDRGPVEALAFGSGNRLATSIILTRANPADRPTVNCVIEIREVQEQVSPARAVASTTNLVHALAFSPKGKYLAFAGGDRQDISLVDLTPPQLRPVDLSGTATQGASIWDVGFAGDGLVAYSYEQRGAPVPPSVYWGFDLKDRSRTSFNGNQVRRAIPTSEGWSVVPVGPLTLNVVQGNQVRFQVSLSSNLDGRWWDYSFLPPGPKHPKPALAIACHRGVVVYRLEDGLRTRFLDGHNGPVYCLAPSEDGKWLATGSGDQTVRLWGLAGCDVLAPLGVTFERRGASLAVTSVDRAGFAEISGVEKGDVFDQFGYAGQKVTIDEFLKAYPTAPPNIRLEFIGRGRRQGADGQLVEQVVGLGTSKRDRPLLSLFVGLDREWVLWTSPGYYDSSVVGDANFLGWQINRSTVQTPKPTEFLPILTYEKTLRQPKGLANNLIGELLGTADEATLPGPARVDPIKDVQANLAPSIKPIVGAGGVPLTDPAARLVAIGSPIPQDFSMAPGRLSIDWRVESLNGKPLGPFEVRQEGKLVPIPQAPVFDPVAGVSTINMQYDLPSPGSYVFTAQAYNGTGIKRELSITATVEGIPPKKPAQLKVLAIAPSFENAIPVIRSTDKDVTELAKFFTRHLVTEPGEAFVKTDKPTILDGKQATSAQVLDALQGLSQGQATDGDLVVVVIETYVLAEGLKTRLVVSDSKVQPLNPATTIQTEKINETLEALVKRGCKVIVVLDGSHEGQFGGLKSEVVEWVRTLRNQYKVVTVVATTRKPIRDRYVADTRPLAQSILDSIQWVGADKLNPLMSLADFRKAILDKVLALTKNSGEPAVYIPEGTNAGSPILNRKL